MSAGRRWSAAALTGLVLGLPACTGEAPSRHLYLDVHRMGAGKVRAGDVAEAHQKDLAIQGDYDVDYQRYWVDEESGTVYCLVEAPTPEAAAEVHRRAHGLVADELVEVEPGILPAVASGAGRLYLDTHVVEPGSVTPEDVAAAHRKDLEAQGELGVRFLEYWVSPEVGRIYCLAEAPDDAAVTETHRRAHGLVPDALQEVVAGH